VINVPVTIVPDQGGTPTVVLAAPAPIALVVGETAGLSLTYADNVGLHSGDAEVTGGFTSGGLVSYPSLTGTTQTKVVPIASAEAPFGVPATVTAHVTDVSARSATLATTSIAVAYHRLNAPLPAGPYPEGSLLSATFKISPSGRARAAALRFEVGTLSGSTFTIVNCTKKSAPLADLESLSLLIPVGRTGLVIRSVLVDSTGAVAVGAKADGLTLFQDAIATIPDGANPTAAISSPAAGASFASGVVVPVTVNATDDVRVASVSVTLDGITKVCTGSPCSVSFFAPKVAASTPYTISATAKDAANKTGTASVSITVTPPTEPAPIDDKGDGKAPVVRFLTPWRSPEAVPANAYFVPSAEATDADGIARIEFFLDDSDRACATLDPSVDPAAPRAGCFVAPGSEGTIHRLRARATDGSGQSAEAEASLVIRDGVRVAVPTTIVTGDGAYEGKRLFVESDVRVEGTLRVEDLYVRHGASLVAGSDGRLDVVASGDFVADVGSRVSATGAAPHAFVAPTVSGVIASPEGAPHGGDAGREEGLRLAYDSFASPALPGASGMPAGTKGGGVIQIRSNNIVFGGPFDANGEAASPAKPARLGLGAGGSIVLSAIEGVEGPVDSAARAAFGLLSAHGGATDATSDDVPASALGAGGRIAVRAPRVEPPLFDVTGSIARSGLSGGAGTFYLRDDAHPHGVLVVSGLEASRTTHVPALGCGVFEPISSDEVRAPRHTFGLTGLSLVLEGTKTRFEVTGETRMGLKLLSSDGLSLGPLAGRRFCGSLGLDEMHFEGARLVVGDALDVPSGKVFVDEKSKLEKP